MEAFLAADHEGPVVMLNVLKFKDRATGEASSGGSGSDAYARYGADVTKLVEATGGRILYFGPVISTLIGTDDDDYDAVALVEYPSRDAFIEMASSQSYSEVAKNRSAGLAYQLLLPTRPTARE